MRIQPPSLLSKVSRSISAYVRLAQVNAIITGLLIPALVGVFCTYYSDLAKVNPLLFWGPLVSFVIVSIAYTTAAINVESAPETLLEVIDLNERLKHVEVAFLHLAMVEHLCKGWRAAVDEYTSKKLTKQDEIADAVKMLCELLVEVREGLYNFQGLELWNFAVYIYNAKADQLDPIWRSKHLNHPSRGMGRSWKPGQGHVGSTFTNGLPRVASDATQPEIAQLLRAPGTTLQAYDDKTYVSIHSEPILRHGGLPYGVIVATSDHAGRFSLATTPALENLAGELSSLFTLACSGRPLRS